jgi:L-methionine (R)-S-oxide reductase
VSTMLDEKETGWLRELLARHGAIAGTVHRVDATDQLALTAAVNIPPPVQAVTATIPRGRGMAGLAWQHDKPIQTCNLKDDTTGAVRPGAKAVDARAAIALPVHAPTGAVRAIVGLAWTDDRVLADDVVAAIAADAASLP